MLHYYIPYHIGLPCQEEIIRAIISNRASKTALETRLRLGALMSSMITKSLLSKLSKISISPRKHDQPSTNTTTTLADAAEGMKADNAQCLKKLRKKRLRSSKSRKCTISILAGCRCQSRRVIVPDQIPTDTRMPEVCSVQSIPSSSSSSESKVETCPEWISSASFDEMIKWASNSNDRQEVHYDYKSSKESHSQELHISRVKFNDLVNSLQGSEQISTTLVHSAGIDQKFDDNLRPNVNEYSTRNKRVVQCNVGKSFISKRKDGLTESLLIKKLSCDPRREFKESMMEMIVENKIKDGEDMEELLACYLFLNSEDYHDVIIQVFKQIWAEIIQV